MLDWLSLPSGPLTDWIYTVVGLVLLLLAGDSLVKGAVNLSLRLGVPALIVSLTIVAFGTSAPELLISVQAIWDGVPDLALGNVVGSNTANVLLVLGIPALMAVMHTSTCDTRTSYLQMMAGTLLFIGLAYRSKFDWLSGIVLLTALAAILIHAAISANRHRKAGMAVEDHLEDLAGIICDLKDLPENPVALGITYKDDSLLNQLEEKAFRRTSRINPLQDLGITQKGVAGETIIPKISNTLNFFKKNKHKVKIEVDGGLTTEVIDQLNTVGVDYFAGWSIVKGRNLSEISLKLDNLKKYLN